MTPETREELARAASLAIGEQDGYDNHGLDDKLCIAYLDQGEVDFGLVANAIAPIIERLVAERVAAETERCANALRPVLFPTDYNYKQALAAIRSATR